MSIYIVSTSLNKELVENFSREFTEAGFYNVVLLPAQSDEDYASAVNVETVILWISSNTDENLYQIAEERNKKGLITINYFAEPTSLDVSKKKAIGRNQSVFAEMNPDSTIQTLMEIIEKRVNLAGNGKKAYDDEVSHSDKTNIADSSSGKANAVPVINPIVSSSESYKPEDSVPENAYEATQTEGESNEGVNKKVHSPKTAMAKMIGNVAGIVVLGRMFHLDDGYILFLIAFLIPIYLNIVVMIRLNNWRKIYGSNAMVVLAFIVGILTIILCPILAFIWVYAGFLRMG